MKNKTISASEVAKAFLLLSQPEIGDGVTNLKLQKLLYYAQGFHLALYKKPLFDDQIVAWEHGPVVKKVYGIYKKNGAGMIALPRTKSSLDEERLEYIQRIWKLFGQFSAWKLRDMTHQEDPWKNTRQSDVISHKSMQSFFETRIEKRP